MNRRRTKRSTYHNTHSNALEGLQGSSKLWIGKDYTNFIVKDFTDLESPFTGMYRMAVYILDDLCVLCTFGGLLILFQQT